MPYVQVATLSDVPPGTAIQVQVGREQVGLFNVDGELYAIGNMCTHVGAPLHEGVVEAGEVLCPLHFARFDLATGRALSPPAPSDTPVFRVKVEGDAILIEEPE